MMIKRLKALVLPLVALLIGIAGADLIAQHVRVNGISVFGAGVDVGVNGVRLSGDGDGAITLLGLGDGSDENLTLNLDDVANTIGWSSSTGVTTWTLTGLTTLNFGAAGVRLTQDEDGAITFLGLGNGSDEDLTINLDDTANTVVVSSSTGVDQVTMTGIGLSLGTTPATAGLIRLPNAQSLGWRNAADTNNVAFGLTGGNIFSFDNGAAYASGFTAGTSATSGFDLTVNLFALRSATVFNAPAGYQNNGILTISQTAPTVSGFGTTPSVVASNGTAAFTIDVGTGGSASTGTITLPTATTGWVVSCYDVTTPASFITHQTGGTTTTATVTNYSRTTGLAIAWTASDILRCSAIAY